MFKIIDLIHVTKDTAFVETATNLTKLLDKYVLQGSSSPWTSISSING